MTKTFIKNCWYVAAWSSDLPEGVLYPMSVIGEPIVLYRRDDGGVTVLEDRCCHRFAPMSKGRVEDGRNIRCMYHGMKFDPSGVCIEIPCQDKIPSAARIRTYPVVEQAGWVWVWMGDVEKADPALIPPLLGVTDEEYILRPLTLDYDADYELISDNLMDLSHLAFVHKNTFGAMAAWAKIQPTVRRIPRGVRVSRWLNMVESMAKHESGAPRLADFLPPSGALYTAYDYLAPAAMIMYNTYHPLEAMPADGVSPPAPGTGFAGDASMHFVTPMADRKARYFLAFGMRAANGTVEQAEAMVKLAGLAFQEDRDMIEGQQRIMDTRTSREVVLTSDLGVVQMRSVIRQLIKEEGGQVLSKEFTATEVASE